ncbi:MAG TPA: recombinase family protein [Acidothermaceae bacterium]
MHGEGGGRPPYGWVATGGGAEAFAPVRSEIVVLKKIARLRTGGHTLQGIADELNEAGTVSKTGRPWNRATIFRALGVIERFGIPADIDAATKAAHLKAAQKNGGGISNNRPSGRSQRTSATRVT